MTIGVDWFTDKNVQLVEPPKAPAPSMREQADTLLMETAKTGKRMRVPLKYANRFQEHYQRARDHGYIQHIARNGAFAYLWWEKKPTRKGK